MAGKTIHEIAFIGSRGSRLAARLDTPVLPARAYALFAHCFTCSKDIFAASRISRALAEKGIATLRFDFTGLGHSDGEFANTDFSSNIGDLVAAANWLREHHAAPLLLVGHSLGGAAVLAGAHAIPEAKAVATIGAPSDFSRMPLWIRASGWVPPIAFPSIDLAIAALNLARVSARALGRATGMAQPRRRFKPYRFRRLPFRVLFQWLESKLKKGTQVPGGIALRAPLLYQPRNVALGALRPLFREGANDEPRATAEQFARWLRSGKLVSHRVRHDIAAAFPRIQIPLAIFFGDEDPFATVRTTRNVYRSASSEYLLWRPVRGNSHLELTMGYDIRQICYDLKNLITYAIDHDGSRTPLPRRRRAPARGRS